MSTILYISTTGTLASVVIDDLGKRAFTHPIVSYQISPNEFSIEELQKSNDILGALDNGYITFTTDVGAIITTSAQLTRLSQGNIIQVTKTTPPTINDDSNDGYFIGDLWINAATDKTYVAVDVTVGAAVWKNITVSTTAEITDFNATTDARVQIAKADDAETQGGANDTKWISPLKLANWWTNIKTLAHTFTNLITFKRIAFDTAGPSTTLNEGHLAWNPVEKTLDVKTDFSDVTLQTGQEVHLRAYNATGSTIVNGSVVYPTGMVTGDRLNVALAKADIFTTSKALGVTTHDIPNNSEGIITISGLIRDVNTSSFSAGNELFVSESVAGGIQTTIPANFPVFIGRVQKSHITQGIIQVEFDRIAFLRKTEHVIDVTFDATYVLAPGISTVFTEIPLNNLIVFATTYLPQATTMTCKIVMDVSQSDNPGSYEFDLFNVTDGVSIPGSATAFSGGATIITSTSFTISVADQNKLYRTRIRRTSGSSIVRVRGTQYILTIT